MQIHVLKFGGTSMADHQTWKQVLDIIKKYEHPIVVVSATARTTRQLVKAGQLAADDQLDEAFEIADSIKERHHTIVEQFLAENAHPKNELIRESCRKNIDAKIGKLKKLLGYAQKSGSLSPQMKDAIASTGEQISSYLLAQCGLAVDILSQHIEARKIIKTDNEYGQANPNMLQISQRCGSLETVIESGFTPVIGGFYGEAPDKTLTTLGFEGSDYTASLIGGAMQASAIEIWTDVSGIYTGDPRFIEDARPLSELSYHDATEMAYFGAKVLHPATLKPAQERNIPVLVKNMFEPEAPGTRIVRESNKKPNVLALSFKEDMALLTVSAYETVMGPTFLTRVFDILKQHHLRVDAVNTTEASVTVALKDQPKLDDLSADFLDIGRVTLKREKGLISIIGCTLHTMNRLMTDIFEPAAHIDVDMISFTQEKRILNLMMQQENLVSAAQNIHKKLFSESE